MEREKLRILAVIDAVEKSTGWTDARWETIAGVGEGTIRKQREPGNEEREFSPRTVLKLCEGAKKEGVEVTPDDMRSGKWPSVNAQREVEGVKLDRPTTSLHTSNALRGIQFLRATPDAAWGDHLVPKGEEPAELDARRLVRVQTDRMAPRYQPRDIIVLERATPVEGDHVWVEVDPGPGGGARAAMLRRLDKQSSTELKLTQYNPAKTHTVERKRVFAIYRVLTGNELLEMLGVRA